MSDEHLNCSVPDILSVAQNYNIALKKKKSWIAVFPVSSAFDFHCKASLIQCFIYLIISDKSL